MPISLFNGELRINIIIKHFQNKSRLPKLKPAPSNLRMVDQTTIKLVGLI